jgi:DNA-binding GntR family transcriptional regulator
VKTGIDLAPQRAETFRDRESIQYYARLSGGMDEITATLPRSDLHRVVVASLRDLMVTGVLPPGSRLDEPSLCKTPGLSRTPLREAIKVLASEQLVTIVPHRGAYVAPLLAAETGDVFEVLASLDSLVGTVAASRASPAEIDRIAALHVEMAGYHLCIRSGGPAAWLTCRSNAKQNRSPSMTAFWPR